MQERGVTIALGTDTPFPHLIPGFSLHDELSMYVDAGIKPVDALRSGTSIGARVLGVEAKVGRIAPGMTANLIVVKGNPLKRIEDIGNIEFTIRDGRIFLPRDLLPKFRSLCAKTPDDAITKDLLNYVNGN
jgi:imidazolonepropionase-like amidohydrolase